MLPRSSSLGRFIPAVLALFLLPSCGLQSIPQQKNGVDAALAEITNQYKRRGDLVPNLVNVVKGYAKHEADTLTAVTEARAKASTVSIDPSKMNPEQVKKFQDAQGSLSQALGRLLVVVEKYPDLKADRNFQELQAQLEGTENRIAIARQRYIEQIKLFNDLIAAPPTSWTNSLVYKYEKTPQWTVPEDVAKRLQLPPKVEF